jgi:hypothetical protein
MDCVDEELLERMRGAGCRSIYYDIESGSERMQKVIEKRKDLSMVDSASARSGYRPGTRTQSKNMRCESPSAVWPDFPVAGHQSCGQHVQL